MDNEEYKMQIACKQVYTVLGFYNPELVNLKIPKEVLDKLEDNSAEDYDYNIEPNEFNPDTLTEEAIALLLILFDKYFANQNQKNKINKFLNDESDIKYDSTILFNSKKEKIIQNEEGNDLVIYKSNIIKRIINKIKSILKK